MEIDIMEIDINVQRLFNEANSIINEYKQHRNASSEPVKREQARSCLQLLERELNRVKRLHEQDVDDAHRVPTATRSELDPEIRKALREMAPAEREKLVAAGEPSVINALKTAPPWLSGVTSERLKQLEQDALANRNKDRWAQQEVDDAALQELDRLIKSGLRQLYEGAPA
jgi:hypothetical protein